MQRVVYRPWFEWRDLRQASLLLHLCLRPDYGPLTGTEATSRSPRRPEIDRAGWFSIEEAREKILKGQAGCGHGNRVGTACHLGLPLDRPILGAAPCGTLRPLANLVVEMDPRRKPAPVSSKP